MSITIFDFLFNNTNDDDGTNQSFNDVIYRTNMEGVQAPIEQLRNDLWVGHYGEIID